MLATVVMVEMAEAASSLEATEVAFKLVRTILMILVPAHLLQSMVPTEMALAAVLRLSLSHRFHLPLGVMETPVLLQQSTALLVVDLVVVLPAQSPLQLGEVVALLLQP